MRFPTIRNGQLVREPSSYEEGYRDRNRAEHELQKVDAQLADATRPLRYQSVDAYNDWAGKARHARTMLGLTVEKLDAWLAENRPWWGRTLYAIAESVDDLDENEKKAVVEAREEFTREDAAKAKARTG